ncbi:MAG: FAD-dependent thymidylate synthase [Halanaerobiaceae bacterium]
MEVEPKAELIDYTPDPEKNVAVAARLCYSEEEGDQLHQEMDREQIESLVRKIVDLGHTSTLEHTYFYFHIRCSRVTSHQLVRQRIGVSYSQRSQRYVNEDNFDYIIPPSINKNQEAREKFQEKMEELKDTYLDFLERDIPKEDARFVLPTIKTNLMVSYNARSLKHFFRLRCCNRAQWEIRGLAREMLSQVREVAPILFEKAGATCDTEGYCPEGELSCGKVERTKPLKGEKDGPS